MKLKNKTRNPFYVLIFGTLVAMGFTAAIMALHAATLARVQRQEQLFVQRAFVELFGLQPTDPETGEPVPVRALPAEQIEDLYSRHIWFPERGNVIEDPQTGAEILFAEAYDVDEATGERTLRGLAFPIYGIGFWARIEGWMAVNPDVTEVQGIIFLSHSETPGLGGRITEPRWRRGFEGLSIETPDEDGQWIYIDGDTAADPTSPRFRRHVERITGATGTSVAVQNFLRNRIPEFRGAATAALEAGVLPMGRDDETYWQRRQE